MDAPSFSLSFFWFLTVVAVAPFGSYSVRIGFSIEEATLKDLQLAFNQKVITSRQLVEFYIEQIRRYNPRVRGVIEVNPDALYLADKADRERQGKAPWSLPLLHGIPVLVKDNIATRDKLNTTAGSFALLGSIVPRDAGVVKKLRKAGAIILGKASLSEWSSFRSRKAPPGWNARFGQGREPYKLGAPCGSSSGSAISVSANMVAITLGTETDGSILCPASFSSVVGIKPTIGLTSRAGVVPISPRQDTVGPICRTVSDATYVLDVIVGTDIFDNATYQASHYIPRGGYSQFLKPDGLRGKRLGIVDGLFGGDPFIGQAFEKIFKILRKRGAILVKNLTIENLETIISNHTASGELTALLNEFKISINAYLKELVSSPIRSLSDAIAFNQKHADVEKIEEYGQELFDEAEATKGIGMEALLSRLAKLSKDGIERTMSENKLDAVVSPGARISPILAIGGLPGITVPAGYTPTGRPFGIEFGGLKGFEPKLIEIAYGFEQATKRRKPPSLKEMPRSADEDAASKLKSEEDEDFMN